MSIYKRSKSLWERDHKQEGFQWVDADNRDQSIFSFIRYGAKADELLVVICNFTEHVYKEYKVGVPEYATYNEILNSDDIQYGGSGQVNKKRLKVVQKPFHNQPAYVEMTIPPFGVSILRPVKTRRGNKRDGNEKEVRSHVTSRGKR